MQSTPSAQSPQSTASPLAPPAPPPAQPLSLAEAQNILSASKIELAQLTPAFFAQLRQTLFQNLQEVTQ